LGTFSFFGSLTLFLFCKKRKPVLKEKNNSFFGKAFFLKERFERTITKKETLFPKEKAFTEKCYRCSLVCSPKSFAMRE